MSYKLVHKDILSMTHIGLQVVQKLLNGKEI